MPDNAGFAVLADVHGNEAALRAVLDRLDELRITRILHAGDLVGYGSSPAECIALAREREFICVQGNHDAQAGRVTDPAMRPDAAAALAYTAQRLSPDDLAWLAALPLERTVPLPGHPLENVLLVHGALTGRDDYIATPNALADNQALLMMRRERAAFFGHTHIPLVAAGGKIYTRLQETRTLPIDPADRTLANPGAVGQPRDGFWKASFLHVSADGRRITYERVSYNLAEELRRQKAANLPEPLARRLALGR